MIAGHEKMYRITRKAIVMRLLLVRFLSDRLNNVRINSIPIGFRRNARVFERTKNIMNC
jgi:hypothetical protein